MINGALAIVCALVALWSLWDAKIDWSRGDQMEALWNLGWGIYGWILYEGFRRKWEETQ